MFEFGHPDQILSYRGSNVHDRVNRIRFNTLGNKVCSQCLPNQGNRVYQVKIREMHVGFEISGENQRIPLNL